MNFSSIAQSGNQQIVYILEVRHEMFGKKEPKSQATLFFTKISEIFYFWQWLWEKVHLAKDKNPTFQSSPLKA